MRAKPHRAPGATRAPWGLTRSLMAAASYAETSWLIGS
jgi:hypothetical protein